MFIEGEESYSNLICITDNEFITQIYFSLQYQ